MNSLDDLDLSCLGEAGLVYEHILVSFFLVLLNILTLQALLCHCSEVFYLQASI